MKLPYDDVHLIADPLYGYLRITPLARRRDRRAGRHRQPVGAAPQAHPPAAELVVGVPDRRAQPLRAQPGHHAPGRRAGAAGLPHAGRGRAGHAVAAAGGGDAAPGRPAARPRPRPVQPLLRRGVPAAGVRHRPRADLAAPHRRRARVAARRAAAQPDGRVRRRRGRRPVARRLPRARRGGRAPAPRRAASSRRRRRIPSRAGCVCSTARSPAPSRSTTWTTCAATPTCAASASGPVDVDRLIYYTFCTADGLTFHKRALSSLRAFLNARFYMYENVYFHRVGHAIDLHLHEIFRPTLELILPASPLEDPGAYRRLTEWSLFTTVEAWLDEPLHSERRELAEEWQSIIHRHVKYSMVYEHHVERQQPLPATRDLTREEFHAAIVRRLPPAAARHRVRGRHRLAGPAAAQPVRRAQAAAGLRPGHRPHRGAAAERHPRVRAGQGAPVPGVRGAAASTSASSPSPPRRRWARSSRRASRTSERRRRRRASAPRVPAAVRAAGVGTARDTGCSAAVRERCVPVHRCATPGGGQRLAARRSDPRGARTPARHDITAARRAGR